MAKKKTNRKEHHVVPNKKGGWDVKINNAGHRTYHTRKKSTAVKKARAISRRHRSELVIHNSKGRIEIKNSHDVIRRGKPGPKVKKIKRKAKKVARKAKRKAKRIVRKKVKKAIRSNRKRKAASRKVARKARRTTRRKVKKAVRSYKRAKRRARRTVRRAIRRRR